ncbi:phenylacetic acid degradation protein PaaN [Ferrovibrio sp.]|uniref:phenylacetic acid degradation protein PaaN n=1 Tax=Ferrovibrio sp. TaxID=1917215 RepID=UPI00311FFEDB
MVDFWPRHAELLKSAVDAASKRIYWSPYPEIPSPSAYGETAKADGEAEFKALLGKPFELGQPGKSRVGKEISPFGLELNVSYEAAPVDEVILASSKAANAWADADVEARVGVCAEILQRLNKKSFLIANAVMHTSGQAFPMAFQAGGPHAQDRGLEALAYAYAEMTRVPSEVRWEKPQGKNEPLRLDKTFRVVARGIGLVIGCATFPTWNSYPGLFASLATGNSVIVKPHPAAILPLAITVRIAREVLTEAGYDPNVVMLAADELDSPVTKALATHPEVAIIDYTGSSTFGAWIRREAAGKLVYTEEAGVNSIVVDSSPKFKAMCDNIAFSISLYSGQMCTAPQNIYVPADGIETDEGPKSFDDVASGIAAAVDKLLSDPVRAAGVLGAIQSDATLERIGDARKLGKVVRDSSPVPGPNGAPSRTMTPIILAVDAKDEQAYLAERFGPIAFIIKAATRGDSISRAAKSAKQHGAITAAIYTTDDAKLQEAEKAFAQAAVSLSVNLIGGIFVNQSAAFSDFHVTGGNPAGNASLTDTAFVANRFRVVAVRRLAA